MIIKNINLRLALVLILIIANLFSNGQASIQMQSESGVFYIPCKVNGLKLKFIFDTGASNVSISLSEAKYMLENGYLDDKDLGASEYYRIANGDIKEGTVVNLKTFEVGGIKLYNVKATIIHSATAPLLLGQSALEKFGKFSFDYTSGMLALGDGKNRVSFQSDYTSDTTYTNIYGQSYRFALPAGYIDYYKIDSSYLNKITSFVSDDYLKPVLFYITSSNLFKMIAADSVFFTRYFELAYSKQIVTPCGDERFSRICEELCKNKYEQLSTGIATKLDSFLKLYDNDGYIKSDVKVKDLNFCQKKDEVWVYVVSIVKESVDRKSRKLNTVEVSAIGYIRINNRLFHFLYSDVLDEQNTLEDFVVELEKILNKISSSPSLDSKAYFDLAMQSYGNLNYKDALSYLNESIKQDSKYADSYFLRASIKANMGDSIDAIQDYDKYILLKPNYAQAYYNRGLLQIKIGEAKKGLMDFNKAIELNPREGAYYGLRGTAKILCGERNDACSDFDKAINLGTKDAIELKERFCNDNKELDWLEKGNLKAENKEYKGAISDYTKAIELNPKLELAYYNRGCTKIQITDYKGAIIDLTKVIDINPNSEQAYINRGFSNMHLELYQAAISDYTSAIQINPKSAIAFYNRGLAKVINNLQQSGCADFRKAIELNYTPAYEQLQKHCK